MEKPRFKEDLTRLLKGQSLNLKQLTRYVYVLFLIFFFGCQQDDIYMSEQSTEGSATITKISFSQIKSDPKHRRVAGTVDKFKESIKLKHNATGRLVYNEEYGFYIDEENGIYIEDGEKHSYTFRIERPETGEKIENIVFTTDGNGGYKTMLVRYDIDKDEFYTLTEAELKERDTQLAEYDPTAKDFSTVICTYTWKFVKPNKGDPGYHEDPSLAWGGHWIQVWDCEFLGGGGASGGGGNSGPTGPSGPTNGGGGGGASGGPFLDEPMPPIVTTPIVEKYHKKNCEKLKKMVDTPGLISKLQDLKLKAHLDREYGYGVQNNPNGSYNSNATSVQSVPNNPNVINAKQVLGQHFIGIFHTHPNPSFGYYPMFSGGDVLYLKDVAQQHDNYGLDKNYSDYFITLTTIHGTYALKINDYTKLKDALSGSGFKDIDKELFDKYNNRKPDDAPELFIKDLLDVFKKFDMGVSLFEAEETTDASGQPTYNWKGVSLNENPISQTMTLKYQPCN